MAGETTQADGYTTTAFKTAGKVLGVLDVSHEITTAELQLADVINVGVVPNGATYVSGYIATDDLDSNGSPLLDLTLGDSTDPDGLQATGTVGQAAAITTLSGTDITNARTTTQEETISLTVTAAAATAVAGTIRVVVFYYTA